MGANMCISNAIQPCTTRDDPMESILAPIRLHHSTFARGTRMFIVMAVPWAECVCRDCHQSMDSSTQQRRVRLSRYMTDLPIDN